MQTEFTCGIYTASFTDTNWDLKTNDHAIAIIGPDGTWIRFVKYNAVMDQDMLIEIAVLMNNIKRQYKALQTN